MATDYINKDMFRQVLINTPFYPKCKTTPDLLTSVQDRLNYTLELLDNFPPADVRPAVSGRWIKVGGFYTPGGDPVWECSECGKGRHVYGIEHGTYGADISDGQWVACPNCGADMKGGDAE